MTLTPAVFSGIACDTFLLSGLFPLHFLTAWVRQTLLASSNRIAASLQVAKNNFHLSVKHLLKWSWITSGPCSHLVAHPCSQSPHPSAGELPVQTSEAEQLRSLLVLPFLSCPCPVDISLHHWMSIYAHFQKGEKENGQRQQRSGWASLKMWDLSRDSKGVGQLAKRFCGGRALLGGSARALHQERAWCAHRAGEQEDSGRRGDGQGWSLSLTMAQLRTCGKFWLLFWVNWSSFRAWTQISDRIWPWFSKDSAQTG